ncbi:MAG: helix-turn-helix domain-containing protein [Fibrobacteres bacterium]|nr:helix-turn-helix domain-containing protein [Fibrobacterota bacterium]
MQRRSIKESAYRNTPFPFFIHKTERIAAVDKHDHDFFEIVYVVEGSGICNVGDKRINFKSHQFVFTPEYTPHSFESRKGGKHRQVSIALHKEMFQYVKVKGFDPEVVIDKIRNIRQYALEIPADNAARVEELVNSVYEEYQIKGLNWISVISMQMVHIIALIGRFLETANHGSKKSIMQDPRVQMAHNRFETQYHSTSCFKEILNALNINQRYFIRIFKKEIGLPPLKYLNHIRIEKACELLLYTNDDIVQIAYDVGYGDLTHFNRLFKKFIGVSPTQFKTFILQRKKRSPLPTRFSFPLSRRYFL